MDGLGTYLQVAMGDVKRMQMRQSRRYFCRIENDQLGGQEAQSEPLVGVLTVVVAGYEVDQGVGGVIVGSASSSTIVGARTSTTDSTTTIIGVASGAIGVAIGVAIDRIRTA